MYRNLKSNREHYEKNTNHYNKWPKVTSCLRNTQNTFLGIPSVREGGRVPLQLAPVSFGGRHVTPGHPQIPIMQALKLPQFIDKALPNAFAPYYTALFPLLCGSGIGACMCVIKW